MVRLTIWINNSTLKWITSVRKFPWQRLTILMLLKSNLKPLLPCLWLIYSCRTLVVTYVYSKSLIVSSVFAVKQEAIYNCVEIRFLCYILLKIIFTKVVHCWKPIITPVIQDLTLITGSSIICTSVSEVFTDSMLFLMMEHWWHKIKNYKVNLA